MKKAKSIIRDLTKTLKGKQKVFGYYDVEHNVRESKNLDISALDIIRALSEYEIDFKKLYGVDFDDMLYNDAEGNYISIDTDVKSDNSYNWSSQVVFCFRTIKVVDKYGENHTYMAIMFHRYGDVRGNYTDHMVCDIDDYTFLETLQESSRVSCDVKYKGKTYCIDTDCLKEGCLFDVYCPDTQTDDYDVMLDIDNYRNKKDIKKALIEYLKTA